MTTTEEVERIEEEFPASQEVPEVEVLGAEAVIRVSTPEGTQERRVKLPETTWG